MRIVCCNIIPYFVENWEKMSQNLTSVAVVIGALRVNCKTKGIQLWLKAGVNYKMQKLPRIRANILHIEARVKAISNLIG